MWRCQVCAQEVQNPQWCSGCGALAYCSQKHMNVDTAHTRYVCARMQQQIRKSSKLAATGLAYSEVLSGLLEPGAGTACFQLELCSAHKGLCKYLCGCSTLTDACSRAAACGLGTIGHVYEQGVSPCCTQVWTIAIACHQAISH